MRDTKKYNNIYWLKQECKQIENQIKELSVLSAQSTNGMPSKKAVSSPVEKYNERLEKLKTKLLQKREKIFAEIERVEAYIENIDDAEIRIIARKRFVENKTFQTIGDEMYMARTTAYEKLKRYCVAKGEGEA